MGDSRATLGLLLAVTVSLAAAGALGGTPVTTAQPPLGDAAGAPDARATNGTAADGTPVCAGTVAEPAGEMTLVSVQGARFGDDGSAKTPARILAFGPRGELEWVYRSGADHGVVWSYDIDPLANGNVFVTATKRGSTLLFELDPTTGERVWSEELPYVDTHDADLLDDRHVVIANMRNYDESTGENRDRVLVYDRVADEVVWEWRFADHYDRSVGGAYTDDWTHLNDVDAVGDDRLLLSPRNFDQVLLVNRTTGDVEWTLGSDGDYETLRQQHNPDYLESETGRPTVLVADSENQRVVEYERTDGGWIRTWTLDGRLDWPRDADRLPNGNTLVTDSKHDRVIEVTPDGEVVWEVYGPWLVYDAERLPGDGSNGPTMADADAAGTATVSDAPPTSAEEAQCDAAIESFRGGFGVDDGPSNDIAETDSQTGDGTATGSEDGPTTADGSAASSAAVRTGSSGASVAWTLAALLVVGALAVARRRRR
jgi:hypothetical protein